jgi:uncharacterized RDD family membrane protein YckC
MRCPKCQYISFDSGERCRNCGYEFSLTPGSASIDLPIQTGEEPIGPLGDFALEVNARRGDNAGAALADTLKASPPRPITSPFDLPLFKERRTADDAPLVTPVAVPRPPLSVRRSSPVTPRPSTRALIDEPVLDLDPPGADPDPPVRASAPDVRAAVAPALAADDRDVSAAAPLGPRLAAALVDTAILLTIGAIVLYLTLKICGLPLARLTVVPPVPFASFLLLIAGGYFTLFTAAGGQTIGKMATGIRVVSTNQDLSRVPLGHAVLRAAAYFASALPAGLGFLPILLAPENRAIHDRLADTRVVKA